MTTTTQTADEYKASLLLEGGKRIFWTIESAAIYINLLYPHITMVAGQEWDGVRVKYKLLCEKHGEYSARFDINNFKRGCQCRGCSIDIQLNAAGKYRCPRATKEEKELAAKLYSEGISYNAIARQLGFSKTTIRCWLSPVALEIQRQNTANWNSANPERKKANAHRYSCEFEHGKAASRARDGIRRQQKQNTPERVFIDNDWFEVDRKETWRVFNESLLTHTERREIQELFLEADYLIQQTGVEHHVDHIWPLSIGGDHLMINLQILTGEENLSKGPKFRPEDVKLFCSRLFD